MVNGCEMNLEAYAHVVDYMHIGTNLESRGKAIFALTVVAYYREAIECYRYVLKVLKGENHGEDNS